MRVMLLYYYIYILIGMRSDDTLYATEKRKARRKGKNGTQEFFTPASLVKRMCDKIDDADWADETKTFLEPCFGNGNFLVEIYQRRIDKGIDPKKILETTYGVELMQDNVDECKQRVEDLFAYNGIDISAYRDILDSNLVCSDFFKWGFENWCPLS